MICPVCGRQAYPMRRPEPMGEYYSLDYRDYWECQCGWYQEMI